MKKPTADEALQELMAGNQRYVSGQRTYPHQTSEHRTVVEERQQPFAVLLGCSDSRVPPEIVFDQGLGSLFVVRVAGHVVHNVVLASIEYAVEYLGVPLIMVLGHARCAAVTAAVHGDKVAPHISGVIRAIKPAVELARGRPGDLLPNSIQAHVQTVVGRLQRSQPILARLVKGRRLTIVGAYYHLRTGVVDLIT